MSLFVGIDGGGTRATALAVDGEGKQLARVEGVAGLVLPDRPEAGVDGLADLAARAVRAAAGDAPADALCCALAGAGREAARAAVERGLAARHVALRVHVTTDAHAALVDAFGKGPGILLVAGTGSIAWGRSAHGRTARTGGWGVLLGDEGSGYALALAGLRAWLRAADGRGTATALAALLPDALGLAGDADAAAAAVVPWAAHADKAAIAALAPVVLEAAAAGDEVAGRLADEAAAALARHVAALHRRLGPWAAPVPVALSGGVIASGRTLRPRVETALGRLAIELEILPRRVDGARGAATLARAL